MESDCDWITVGVLDYALVKGIYIPSTDGSKKKIFIKFTQKPSNMEKRTGYVTFKLYYGITLKNNNINI